MRVVLAFLAGSALLASSASSQLIVSGPDDPKPIKIQSTVCIATLGDHRQAWSALIWVPDDIETQRRIEREFIDYVKGISKWARDAGCRYYASYNSIPTSEPRIVATGWTGG